MSETILERMQAKEEERKREILKELTPKELLNEIAEQADMKDWKELHKDLIGFIIEKGYVVE